MPWTLLVVLFWVALLALAIYVYFIPSIVANNKQHPQKTAILLLNIFLGWTYLGWVVALVWANVKEKNEFK